MLAEMLVSLVVMLVAFRGWKPRRTERALRKAGNG